MLLSDIFLGLMALFILILVVTVIANIITMTPFVPTKQRLIDHFLKVAEPKPDDVVYDLGCGDGRLLIWAEKKYDCQTEGYEIALLPYLLSLFYKWFSHAKTNLHFGNFFKADLSRANIIFCYLMPPVLKKLKPKLEAECQPGTKIISHTFKIEGLEPVQIFPRDKKYGLPVIYVYKIK